MNKTYIIGEIGQNHNGSVDIAKLIIDLGSRRIIDDAFGLELASLSAIKLQKRDLNQELTFSEKNKIWNSPDSFGRTYGEHRSFLELNDEEHYELYKYTKSKGLDFVETLCSPGALTILKLFTPDYLKVASRDLTNLPLLSAMGETRLPIILSTGMSGRKELDDALEIITKYHSNISILHCVSEYPAQPVNVNLKTIQYLIESFPQYDIGYSDHTIGISAAVAAITLGSKIIEKHITIDQRMKGTDQAGSLGPDGLARMIRDIRLTEMSLGKKAMFISKSAIEAKKKLERSIASKRKINKGSIIKEDDLQLLSPGTGIRWKDTPLIIGKVAKKDILEAEIIFLEMLENEN